MARWLSQSAFAVLAWLLLLTSQAFCATPGNPWTPFESTWFDTLGTQQGLPYSVTTSLVQDDRGLIWIGTTGGLVRYDGSHMQVFDAEDSSDATGGLPDAYVRCLLMLPDGQLLIGTNAGGLARFDPRNNNFRSYPIGVHGLSDAKIFAMSAAGNRGVWIATDEGIDYLDLHSDTIRHISLGSQLAPRNFSVFQDHAGNLWVGNDRGLFVRRKGSATFTRPGGMGKPTDAILNSQIWAIAEDAKGRIWVGSGDAGVAWRDIAGHWQGVPGYDGGQPDHRQLPTVRAFLIDDTGLVWIGTDGHGLLSYRPGDAKVRAYMHDAAVVSSLPGDTVRALLADKSGNLWAATDLGVARTVLKPQVAFSIMPSPFNTNGLSGNNVYGIHVDKRGRIWLGLSAGKIDIINLEDGSMRHLRLHGSQAFRDVTAFAETADGAIWVGSQGLARIDPVTFDISESANAELDRHPILSLLEDGPYLLIGTYEGIYRYDLHTGGLDHFNHVPGDPGSLASDTVRQITHVGSQVWYATTHGISIAPHGGSDTHDFIQLQHRAGDATSLPQDYTRSITRDSAGRIWVSTFGGIGVIDHYQPGGPIRFRTIGKLQGLTNDKVNATIADPQGQMWVGMSSTVGVIDPATQRVRNLSVRDGLHIRSYVNTAAAATPQGYMLFGGLGGLTVIRSSRLADPPPRAPVAVTSALINGKSLPYASLPQDGQSITLEPHKRSLQMDFALLDYRAPQSTTYSYRLDGFDTTWNRVAQDSLPSVIYTNLPQGNYQLHLRATTRGMYPNTTQTMLRVMVKPRWFETTLFRLAALIALVVLVIWLIQLRTAYLSRQARRLQRQVDERTHDLQVANRRLDHLAGTDELTGVYNRRRFLSLVDALRRADEIGPMCMALLDLDRFKQVNDSYGHLAGDAVIRAVIEVIQQHCRPEDLVGRYGGEELLMCLPGVDTEDAMQIAEGIRATVADTIVTWDEQPIAVTVSIGVTALRSGEAVEQWLARADTALYEAKNSGRNRCVRLD